MANSVTIVGRTGQDPEIKYFDSGSVKARISVAVDRGFGENKTTDWFTVEAWGKQAEFIGEWVKKGQLLAVNGQLELQRWTDQAGNTREFFLVRASDVRFVGSKRENAVTTAGAAY